jgi:K(+)-stimulated pyrophosphate-energized sodium pump
MFQRNAGEAWDNAINSFEKSALLDGKIENKSSNAHMAFFIGNTVVGPFNGTSSLSMNILIKLISIVSLVIAPHITRTGVSMVPTPASS